MDILDRNLRARKADLIRQTLAEAALQLSLEAGFGNITIEDISGAAGCSARTFHRYFQTKEDVLFPEYPAIIDAWTRALLASPPENPPLAALAESWLTAVRPMTSARSVVIRKRAMIAAEWPSVEARRFQLWYGWGRTLSGVLAQRDGRSETTIEDRLRSCRTTSVLCASFDEWASRGYRGKVADVIAGAMEHLAREAR